VTDQIFLKSMVIYSVELNSFQ